MKQKMPATIWLSRGTMQCRRSCQNVYVMPPAMCTHVLYTLIVTVQLSFLSDWSEHRIHPVDTTHTDKVKCWARVPRLKIIFYCTVRLLSTVCSSLVNLLIFCRSLSILSFVVCFSLSILDCQDLTEFSLQYFLVAAHGILFHSQ